MIVGIIWRKPLLTHASIVCEDMLASVNSVNSVKCTKVKVVKTAEPIDISFRKWTWIGPRKHVLDTGAHWRHLANITEPFLCDGDAACCEITLTTCYNLQSYRIKI